MPARQAVPPVLIAITLSLGLVGCDPSTDTDELTIVTDSSSTLAVGDLAAHANGQ